MVSPRGEGLLDQGTVKGLPGYPCMLKPTGKPTPGALRLYGSAVHLGCPGRETALLRLYKAHDHQGQGLEMPPLHPVLRLASHLPQRLIETRPAFHVRPSLEHACPKERINRSEAAWRAHHTFVSQPGLMPLFFWCRRSDSNRHGGLTPAGFCVLPLKQSPSVSQ
jgi:hypothetical protein